MASMVAVSAAGCVSARPSAVRSRTPAFSARRVVAPRRQQHVVAAYAEEEAVYVREYPNPIFVEEVKAAFPDKMLATPDEARVLLAMDYVYLDVRPAAELDVAGKTKVATHVPFMNGSFKYDPELKKKVMQKEDNPDFIKQVEKKFPDKETKLLVGCSDGNTYALDALEALDEAGYTTLVCMKGGFYAWYATYDNNLRRRRNGEYAETYMHDGDSCGIHASGAGFARVDSIEKWAPPKF